MADLEQSTNAPIPHFGEELRKEREMRGISLKEIADSTKISKRFLEAIERNDLAALPAAVFTRGFVREYAKYLGLNAEEMVSRYGDFLRAHEAEQEAKEAAQISSWNAAAGVKETKKAPKAPPELQQRPGRGPLIAGLAVTAIAIAATVWWAMNRPASSDAAQSATTAAEVPAAPVVTETTPPAPQNEGLLLQMNLTEDSWITLQVDGETVLNDELKAGDSKSFEAKNAILFKTIGNAGGLDLTLNGVKVPPLGESGDVIRNRQFDRASLDSLSQNRTE